MVTDPHLLSPPTATFPQQSITRLILLLKSPEFPVKYRKISAKIVGAAFRSDAFHQKEAIKLHGVGILNLFPQYDIEIPSFHTEIAFSDLKIIGQVGGGATAKVRTAYLGSNLVAVKMFFDSADTRKTFQSELLTMNSLKHPSIVGILGASAMSAERLFIVTEYYPNGDLGRLIENPLYRYSPLWTLQFVIDFCDAMHYLHSSSLIHRDVKPDNILISRDWRIALTDFGTTRLKLNSRMTMRIGTPIYMAPELGSSDHVYSEAVDIYRYIYNYFFYFLFLFFN